MCLRTRGCPCPDPCGHEQLGVPAQRRRDLAQRRRGSERATGERRPQIAEQPWPAQAAPPDHDAVAAGLADHGDCVAAHRDVAVAQHRLRGSASRSRAISDQSAVPE